MLSRALTILGWAVLFYSAVNYREVSKALILSNSEPSHAEFIKVIVQIAVGFVLILIGQLLSLKLRNIRVSPDLKAKTFPEVFGRSDFMIFNHRKTHLAKRLAAS